MTSAGLRAKVFQGPGTVGRVLTRAPRPRRATLQLGRRAAFAENEAKKDVDIEDEVEAFMRRQAEAESGAAFIRRDPSQVIGAEVVSDEQARKYCREIVEVLKTLKATRDMTVNEVKLIVAIEDPRTRERRKMDIEDERGVSRDEMAQALVDVSEGRVPKDRIALKCLFEEIYEWPYLTVQTDSETAQDVAVPSSSYAALQDPGSIAKPYVMGKEARAGDKPQTLADLLPDWVGYLALYGISAIPVMLAVGAILVLFYNSLR